MIPNNILKNQQAKGPLHEMRAFAQVAEKFGWTIGGFVAANTLAGPVGISLFGLTMLLFASTQSSILRLMNTDLRSKHIRIALGLRMASFGVMAIASSQNDFSLMLLGSGLSGIFVGLFWPTFYKLKNGNLEGWFLLEKGIGVILTILSGLVIVGWSTTPVFVVSMIAATGSLLMTYRLEVPQMIMQPVIIPKHTAISVVRKAGMLSLLEGTLFEMISMTRRLVVLTGVVVIPGLSGIMSETLFLALAGFLGAIIAHYSNERINDVSRISIGLSICMIGTMMACTGVEKYWILGVLILSIGSMAIFPLTHSRVKRLLETGGHYQDGFRESWRNPGRLLGTIVAVLFWFTFESITAPFFIAISLIMVYWYLFCKSISPDEKGVL